MWFGNFFPKNDPLWVILWEFFSFPKRENASLIQGIEVCVLTLPGMVVAGTYFENWNNSKHFCAKIKLKIFLYKYLRDDVYISKR